MSKAWILAKQPEFVRDVVRDFCSVHIILEGEFTRFDESGQVDFNVLSDLLGSEMNKGLLWRLKDTAHHLFRGVNDSPVVGRMLDWGVGYIFHETMKLKEDAYQLQRYAPLVKSLQPSVPTEREAAICMDMATVLDQTNESILREISRIRFISKNCRCLFPGYLADCGDNHLLARFFFDNAESAGMVFGEEYENILKALYGDRLEQLYLLAAKSLRLGGWKKEALRALDAADVICPGSPEAAQERKLLSEDAPLC